MPDPSGRGLCPHLRGLHSEPFGALVGGHHATSLSAAAKRSRSSAIGATIRRASGKTPWARLSTHADAVAAHDLGESLRVLAECGLEMHVVVRPKVESRYIPEGLGEPPVVGVHSRVGVVSPIPALPDRRDRYCDVYPDKPRFSWCPNSEARRAASVHHATPARTAAIP